MKYQDKQDIPISYFLKDFWLWFAKRLKPNDQCYRWSYWRCRWELVTISKQIPNLDAVEIVILNGYEFELWYRIRPLWYRYISPSYWLNN